MIAHSYGMTSSKHTDPEIDSLVELAADGDEAALTSLFEQYRQRLKNMVRVRLNQNLRGRVDESDVVQDAYVEAAKRLNKYATTPDAPFFLWLRKITAQRIIHVHRVHLGAKARDARLEVELHRQRAPMATSVALAEVLLGGFSSPTQAAVKAETRLALQESLAKLSDLDREILSLRHFEFLTNGEAAEELGIDSSTASKRYLRALQRLKLILEEIGVVA